MSEILRRKNMICDELLCIITSGPQYIICNNIQYSSSNKYKIVTTLQVSEAIIQENTGASSGWNAGGGVHTQQDIPNNAIYWSTGAGKVALQALVKAQVEYTINSGSGAQTTYTFRNLAEGTTYSANRSHGSLSTYAATTGFPIGTTTNSGGSILENLRTKLKLFDIKIYVNDTLTLDAKPKLINGIPGLYDSVSDTFLQNTGTGRFGYETKSGIHVDPAT